MNTIQWWRRLIQQIHGFMTINETPTYQNQVISVLLFLRKTFPCSIKQMKFKRKILDLRKNSVTSLTKQVFKLVFFFILVFFSFYIISISLSNKHSSRVKIPLNGKRKLLTCFLSTLLLFIYFVKFIFKEK